MPEPGFLGDVSPTERACCRRVAGAPGCEMLCGAAPVVHLNWPGDETHEEGAMSYACEQHWQEIQARGWPLVDWHSLDKLCGMPATLWSYDEKRCITDPDGLRTVEPVRAIAEPVGGAGCLNP